MSYDSLFTHVKILREMVRMKLEDNLLICFSSVVLSWCWITSSGVVVDVCGLLLKMFWCCTKCIEIFDVFVGNVLMKLFMKEIFEMIDLSKTSEMAFIFSLLNQLIHFCLLLGQFPFFGVLYPVILSTIAKFPTKIQMLERECYLKF